INRRMWPGRMRSSCASIARTNPITNQLVDLLRRRSFERGASRSVSPELFSWQREQSVRAATAKASRFLAFGRFFRRFYVFFSPPPYLYGQTSDVVGVGS